MLVKADEAESQTAGGLFIAGDAKEKPQTGVVIAVGDGKLDKDGKKVPLSVAEGDHILYSKYGGNEVHYQGEDYLIVRGDDIYALID